jgi:hypothetical protein
MRAEVYFPKRDGKVGDTRLCEKWQKQCGLWVDMFADTINIDRHSFRAGGPEREGKVSSVSR